MSSNHSSAVPSLTVPTQLSVLRILLTFVIMGLLVAPGLLAKVAALAGFLLASLTDWLDGYLARRMRQTSPAGALIDPIADKVLILGMFAVFVLLRLVPLWMALVIAARELLITWARLLAARRRVVLAAAAEGKQKMVSQVISIVMLISLCVLRAWPAPASPPPQAVTAFEWLTVGCLWIAVVLTAVSGVVFCWRHRLALRDVLLRSS